MDTNPAGSEPTPLKRFAKIPKLIAKKGRVAGFEKLRDMSLEDWEQIAAIMNPYSALKLAIEFDRHAMFAEVAAERAKGTFDRELWDNFQQYLRGDVAAAPSLDNKQESSDAEASE